ncbi:TraR/DksA family transcriptional regulator [Desulfonatronum thioautotrophicum]|uniref:TraR/DksA family transcriptional regulator n=1 Tax=Desulfonatronum thioautotrophicum TaxID=617001 RepID=UPI00069BBC8E|nr:TraR/DksA C4-type zinc finger protein [Desulfonatronum thioautotrophicum]
MTHGELESFRHRLEQLLAMTTDVIDRINLTIRDVVPRCADANEQASLEAERRMLLLQAERGRRLKREIHLAVHRMDRGEYGYCESCGESIELGRLEVHPAARVCV